MCNFKRQQKFAGVGPKRVACQERFHWHVRWAKISCNAKKRCNYLLNPLIKNLHVYNETGNKVSLKEIISGTLNPISEIAITGMLGF